MAVTLEGAAQLVTAARTSPGYLVCAPHVLLSPTYQTIWQRVERGDCIGTATDLTVQAVEDGKRAARAIDRALAARAGG